MLLAASLACAAKPASTSAPLDAAGDADSTSRWRYELALDDALETMQLSLCIEGPRPLRLTAAREAMAFVRSARVRGGPALRRDEHEFVIETLGEHGCVELDIDLEAAVDAHGRNAARYGDDIMIAPDRWLWYPARVPADVDARVRLELPDGVHATVPWLREGPRVGPREADGWYRLEHSSFGWSAWIAFGRFEPLTFEAAGCEFEVAVLDGEREATDAGIQAWLTAAAESSAELYGRFPRARVAAVVLPSSGWGRDPVLFGMARRGGGGSVMLLLDEHARDAQLLGEWVATHELLHLTLPLIRDAWMAEGLVTYYTTVLRARQDLVATQQRDNHAHQVAFALEVMLDGFERGRGGVRSLARASASMHETHSYARVYWGGAAIALDLDRRIRSASANHHSLDDLMRVLSPLALEHRSFAAAELLSMMDAELERWHAAGELELELSATSAAARLLDADKLPRDIAELHGLAVTIDRSQIRLLADPIDEAQLRESIFGTNAAITHSNRPELP